MATGEVESLLESDPGFFRGSLAVKEALLLRV